MSRKSAKIKLVSARGNRTLGNFEPTPVSVTTPRIIPTHEAAAIKDTPLFPAFSIALKIPLIPTRVFE